MEIKITYKLRSSQALSVRVLLPQEYFDPLPGEEKEYSINAVPKYILPYEYINCDLKDIISLALDIKDGESFSKREMFFWNEGKNSTDHLIDFDSEEGLAFEWLITETVSMNDQGFEVQEVLRLYKDENNRWGVKNHSYRTVVPGAEDIVKEMDVHGQQVGIVTGFYKHQQ
ncbi:MAG: hypothetical protein QM791_16855 [Ferruginibacter sp.]